VTKSMQLCGAAWSFVGTTLQESVAIYRALGIKAGDLIALPGAILDSQTVIREPAKEAKRINDLNVQVGNLIFGYEQDAWLSMDQVDVMTETIKMRDLVRSGHLEVLIQTRMVNNS
jgi:hypothetical protein